MRYKEKQTYEKPSDRKRRKKNESFRKLKDGDFRPFKRKPRPDNIEQ